MWPFKNFLIWLKSSHWELSFAVPPTSLRPCVLELGMGGQNLPPPPAGRVGPNTPAGRRLKNVFITSFVYASQASLLHCSVSFSDCFLTTLPAPITQLVEHWAPGSDSLGSRHYSARCMILLSWMIRGRWKWPRPVQLGELRWAESKIAKLKFLKFAQWAESFSYKGIAAGYCQSDRGGLFEKHYTYKAPEQGSKYLYICSRL